MLERQQLTFQTPTLSNQDFADLTDRKIELRLNIQRV
jgi:hypothetical protein